MEVIKIWGLKRSGTNFLRWCLAENLEDVTVLMDVLGWKHGIPTVRPFPKWQSWYPQWCPPTSPVSEEVLLDLLDRATKREIRHVIITKSVETWVASIARYEKSIISLLPDYWLESRVRQWDFMMHAYRNFHRTESCVHVRYEELIQSFESQMKKIAARVGAKLKPELILPEKRLERGNDLQTHRECELNTEFKAISTPLSSAQQKLVRECVSVESVNWREGIS